MSAGDVRVAQRQSRTKGERALQDKQRGGTAGRKGEEVAGASIGEDYRQLAQAIAVDKKKRQKALETGRT